MNTYLYKVVFNFTLFSLMAICGLIGFVFMEHNPWIFIGSAFAGMYPCALISACILPAPKRNYY